MFRYCIDFFLHLKEQEAYYSSLLYKQLQKLFSIIIYPVRSSDKKLCCSLLLLENWEILEKISTNISENVRKEEVTVGQREETLWNWVTNSKTVRVEMPAIMKFFLFTQGKKVLFIVQLDVNSYLESSLRFLCQCS